MGKSSYFYPPFAEKWTSHTASSKANPDLVNSLAERTVPPLLSLMLTKNTKALSSLVESVRTNYNERAEEIRRHWGGGLLGAKSQHKLNKRLKIEAAQKNEKAGHQ